MKNSVIRAAFAAAAFTFALPSMAAAESFSIGHIVVETPWTRATPGGAKVAGGYLRIVNNGAQADRLIGGTSEIAERFEVHSMEMRDGVARMAPVEGGLEIPAGETVELAPGGYHVMFMGLERPLTEGETVSGTLVFERAGTLEVVYPVAAMGVRTAPGDGGHSHHDHTDDATCHHDTTPGHTH
jgi:periplasmic copper chaperone A